MRITASIKSKSSWSEVRARVEGVVSAPLLAVGVFGDKALVASANEYGTTTIPSRSFIRSTMREQRGVIVRRLGTLVRDVLTGEQSYLQSVQELGGYLVLKIRSKILDQDIPPPLAPATVRRKGFSKPLIGLGPEHLIDQIEAVLR